MKPQSPKGCFATVCRFNSPRLALCGALAATALLAACGSGDHGNDALSCDDSLKTRFTPDADTTVLLVKQFRKGDQLVLPGSTVPAASLLTATADVCLVKLLVGPGYQSEPPTAPSYSKGIGIEVWLPERAAWNERIRVYGSGGWAGGFHTDLTRLGPNSGQGDLKHINAFGKDYVVAHSDHGHVGGALGNNGGGVGTFAMKVDHTINTVLFQDFAERSIHVLAVCRTFISRNLNYTVVH